MFDLSFTEIIVIAVVALIVVGPERLPKVARTAGVLLGRLQRYVSDVKSDIQREIQLDDLQKLQHDVRQQAREFETSIRSEIEKTQASLGDAVSEVRSEISTLESEVDALQQNAEETVPVAEDQAQPEKNDHENSVPGMLSSQEQEAQMTLGLDLPPVAESVRNTEKP